MRDPMNDPMNDPSDDMLMALADNELAPAQALALRRRIADDAALAARFAMFEDTRAVLASAFDAGPVPDHLLAAIAAAPVGDPLRDPVVVPLRPRSAVIRSFGAAPLALAATLLLAAGAGGFLAGRGFAPAPGGGDPAALAAQALSQSATGSEIALAGGGTARALGSYDTPQGLCRLIDVTLPGAQAERALACHGGAGWSVLASVAAGGAEEYLPASDSAAALLDRALDDLGAGPALDAAAEAAALARAAP